MTHSFRASGPLLIAALALGACSSKPDAKALTADSAGTVSGGEVTKAPAKAAAPETPNNSTSGVLIAGRKAHDSVSFMSAIRAGNRALPNWPKGPEPAAGAILPHKRVLAYYGNPLSKRMGVLGEYPVDEMLAKLDKEVAAWQKADPSVPVQPALHLVSVVAQGAPGKDGMYRLRMDTSLINKVHGWAKRKNALFFVDVQVGKSTVQAELPRLLPILSHPDVHFALDPEFSMHHEKEGIVPSKKIGQMDAAEINYAIKTLSDLVREKKLPPKILVIHRFTRRMVSNASQIKLDPNVQVVMDMDGWGPPWLKFDSYRDYEVAEPVQFTGFKLFYHNDTKKGDALLTPAEVLALRPRPMYIQYQ